MSVQEAGQAWHEIVCDTLKRNSVRLVIYVPDNVLKPLIKAVHADSYFTTFAAPARRRRSASWPAPGWRACAASC